MNEANPQPIVSAEDFRDALRITPLFYDAVLDSRKWQWVLGELANWFPDTRGSSVHMIRLNDFHQYLHVNYGFTQDETALHMRFKDHINGDPRSKRFLERSPNKPTHCRKLVTDEEWYASPIYKQVFEPINLDYALLVGLIYEEHNLCLTAGVYRSRGSQPFNDYDVAKFQLLVPHLRRAGAVYSRIVTAEESTRTLEHLFGDIGLATFFTDSTGALVHANDEANRLIESASVLVLDGNAIGHENSDVTQELQSAISHVTSAAATGKDARVRHITLPSRTSPAPMQATICSLASNPDHVPGWVSSQTRVAIFVTDPMKSYESNVEKLQRLFGLTGAEADVLANIASGSSPKQIAVAKNRSVETIRHHLKNLMSKTSTNRQAELVRLVLSADLPDGPRPQR